MNLVKQLNRRNKTSENVILPLWAEFHAELFSIADWWVKHSVDNENGGFFGEIDSKSNPVRNANKGIVLNSRLLWFFSELALVADANDNRNALQYRKVADRAFHYVCEHFVDPKHGGFYWEVDSRGSVVKDRKQVYAQAFCIYGLTAYFRMSNNPFALELATQTFDLLENKCVDATFGGFIEAFSREWGEIEDFRLSKVDRNFPKTMNTHLHVLEAYSAFHSVVQSDKTRDALRAIIGVFEDHILNPETLHLAMFMDCDWEDRSQEISYGHEIEYSWLVCEACHVLGDSELTELHEAQAVKIANQVMARATGSGGEIHESHQYGKPLEEKSIWWVQAEAMVGYLNGYEISSDQRFLFALSAVWESIKTNHKTAVNGEWTWNAHNSTREPNEAYMAGFWKGPYHNGRAMMEMLRRLP